MTEEAEAGTEIVSEVPTHQRDGIVSVALANYNIDWIRSSAPFERVNLVAVIRPRIGGKEPSDVYRRM